MKFNSSKAKNNIKNCIAMSLVASVLLGLGLSSSPQTILPITSNQVSAYMHKAEENIMATVHQVTSIPLSQKTSENTMRPWNKLGTDLLIDFAMLTYLTQTDFPSKEGAAQAILGLQAFLYKTLMQNPDLFQSLMSYAHLSLTQGKPLTPYEHYEIHCLLESCDGFKSSLPQEKQEALDQMKALNAMHERLPYIALKSQTPEKTADKTEFTVLNLNTCFVPGQFPFIYGGVTMPWQDRVAPLAAKIITANADIVCLQEVHAHEASFAMYEALKDNYTYFYLAIGPRLLGFSLESLGLPSGLFVASKYPIENPQFTVFSVSGIPMNYGFFDFVVKNGSTSIGHVYTTHMQGLNYEQFAQIRGAQLNQIMTKMQADFSKQEKKMPYFLCGDLNIPFGSKEPGVAILSTSFYDDYNKNQVAICENNRTCTDYFTNYLFSATKNPEKIDPNFQILDYALLLQSLPSAPEKSLSEGYAIKTHLIRMNEIDKPSEAISDHHALVTTISY
jgi:hypothetical protein